MPLTLEWRAPAGCPDGAAARRELESTARIRSGFRLEPLFARVAIARAGARYTARLQTERAGQVGERELDAPDCATLVRSVTLVLALAFGDGVELSAPPNPTGGAPPRASGDAGEGSGAPGAAPPGEVAPATPEEPPLDAEPESRAAIGDAAPSDESTPASVPALRLRALLAGGAQLAPLPAVSTYFALGLELEPADSVLLFQLRAGATPGVTDAVSGGGRARFDGLFVSAAACLRLPLAVLQLSPCARAGVSALRGRSDGLDRNEAAVAPWSVLSGVLSLTWPAAGPVRGGLEAALGVSLDRPRFVVEGVGEVHRVPLLTSELGLVVLFAP